MAINAEKIARENSTKEGNREPPQRVEKTKTRANLHLTAPSSMTAKAISPQNEFL